MPKSMEDFIDVKYLGNNSVDIEVESDLDANKAKMIIMISKSLAKQGYIQQQFKLKAVDSMDAVCLRLLIGLRSHLVSLGGALSCTNLN